MDAKEYNQKDYNPSEDAKDYNPVEDEVLHPDEGEGEDEYDGEDCN